MRFTRRTFLGASLAGLGALALPRGVRAAGTPNLVIVFARGGWDPVWCIDPKEQSSDIDAPPTGTITTFKHGLDVLIDASRPNIEPFFAAWEDQVAIVRGIDVGSIAHFAGHVRMMTGTRTELNPDIGMITAVTTGGDLALPYADIGGGAYAGPHAARMGRLGTRNQIATLINRAKAYDAPPDVGYTDPPLMTVEDDEAAQILAFLDARAERLAAGRGALGDNARRVADYRSCFDRADQLRALPELQALKVSGASTLASQLGLAITMLKGTSRAVYLDSHLDWDTHDTIADQGDNHDALFADLTTLMQMLADAEPEIGPTNVVVMSEMGRTPKLNAPAPGGGKDHWPTTSAMVLGPGVVPGVYGGTDDRLNALTVDLGTGAVDPQGEQLRYDNFAAGVLSLLGVQNLEDWLPNVTPLRGFQA